MIVALSTSGVSYASENMNTGFYCGLSMMHASECYIDHSNSNTNGQSNALGLEIQAGYANYVNNHSTLERFLLMGKIIIS